MKEAVRQRARELGFDDCRVTTANPPESAARFKQWLADGRHGEMAWLERNARKRVDPQQVLPGARSIIALAVSYAVEGRGVRGEERAPGKAEDSRAGLSDTQYPSSVAGLRKVDATRKMPPAPHAPSPSGFIARYARYGDYHQIAGERLKRLTEFMNGLGGADTRSLWYVDTGPLLERDLAQRAGLGFIGKHTNLISRRLGNWVFLAEIITTLELEADKPEENRCGSCTRCLTACLTAAIVAPFQLDARRCISYLTIELRGGIPLDLRPVIGNRIFGCDDCLLACPWNRFAREGQLMGAHARPDLAQPDLLELLALDEAGFRLRFAGTPMLRTRHRGLRRNVSVALGNIGDEGALPALQQAMNDSEPLVSEHAHWAIGQIEARRRANY
jgi:epoxyqueuosine reductase